MAETKKDFFKNIRVRIAPSPTGPLHIGTARTALFNYLFAKKHKGSFILRIEDTDLERSDPEYEKDIIDGLKWLGINWTEGPIKVKGPKPRVKSHKGNYGPYRQSERLDSYTKYLKKLLNSGRAFYCYHSEKELEKERKEKMKKKKAPIHVCEHYYRSRKTQISTQKNAENIRVNRRIDQRKSASMGRGIIRFRPPKKKVIFDDLIRGRVEFDTGLLGDISIAKDLKTPLYNFAVVIDDYEMKISHIIRGEDHISNTPKQILIQETLGFPRPKYAHLPLILGPDKSKLSKRHGAVSIGEYQKQGYLPEALINFMALLGWNPGDDRELFASRELIKEFSLDRVQKGGAIFNIKKLDWLNGCYIRQMPLGKLTGLCLPYLIRNGLIKPKFKSEQYPPAFGAYFFKEEYRISETGGKIEPEKLKKIIALEQERMKKLSEIGELAEFFFKDKLKYSAGLLKWKNMTKKEIKDVLDKCEKLLSEIKEKDFAAKKLEKILMPEAEKTGDRGTLLWPLRVALTGKEASPGPFETAEILGKRRVLKRIREARKEVSRVR